MTRSDRFRARVWLGVLLVALVAALPSAAQSRGSSSATAATAFTADDLFDPSAVRDIRLVMKPSDWDLLVEHYMDDTYYRADLEWNGQTVPIVGVRSRGSGSRNPYKPSLKIDMARYVDQKFVGLKSVVLANAVQDPSMLKQRASMLFFTKMGVPAPRVAHVRVFVNDVYLGLYMLIEPIDKTFLARMFGTDASGTALSNGYLYEYAWKDGYQFEYLGADLQIYADLFEAKTRETEAPSVLYGPLEDLFRDVNEAPDAGFVQAVGEHLDLAKFVRFIAVENFLADRDSFLGYWGANNFYFYRFLGSRGAEFIAWDKDLAFWAYDYDIFQGARDNVLARRVLSDPALYRLYLDTLLACAAAASAPVSEEDGTAWFEAEVRKEIGQIHAAGLADERKPYTNERFDDELEKVLTFARNRAAFVAREAGKEVAEGRLFR